MSPSQRPRLHWSQRQQQQQHQQLQHALQLLSNKAAINDTLDVLEACGSHPQQSEWRRLWELASSRYFDRQHRVLWWRILHGSLMCGAGKRDRQTYKLQLQAFMHTTSGTSVTFSDFY